MTSLDHCTPRKVNRSPPANGVDQIPGLVTPGNSPPLSEGRAPPVQRRWKPTAALRDPARQRTAVDGRLNPEAPSPLLPTPAPRGPEPTSHPTEGKAPRTSAPAAVAGRVEPSAARGPGPTDVHRPAHTHTCSHTDAHAHLHRAQGWTDPATRRRTASVPPGALRRGRRAGA